MAINMSYCRLENTYNALQECVETGKFDAQDHDLSESEVEYKKRLLTLCRLLVDDYADLFDSDKT